MTPKIFTKYGWFTCAKKRRRDGEIVNKLVPNNLINIYIE